MENNNNKRKRDSKSINENYEIIKYYNDLVRKMLKMLNQRQLIILN
jgi:hypothetical protein